MLDAETLYNQNATRFSLRFFVRGKTEVEGPFMLELANTFLSDLLFPGCRPVSLDTKLPGIGRKLNMGEFSERRPAFLSREETSEGKRQMLGYFYRERSSVVP